jgi:hypothetical protein
MEGTPTYLVMVGFGLPFYVPAMIIGGIVGYLVKQPGKAFLISFLTTQLLASLAWILVGNYPELVVYFLLPSLLTSGLVFLLTPIRGCESSTRAPTAIRYPKERGPAPGAPDET